MFDTTTLKEALGTNAFAGQYGYGHTAESAKIVRSELNHWLETYKAKYGLKISVTKSSSGYGGPRVEITSNDIRLDKKYEYIVNSDGSGIGDGPGKLFSAPVSTFPSRPHHTARLVTPERLEKLNKFINTVLAQFGRDNDDAMTDYFDNTMPLFYGVQYKA